MSGVERACWCDSDRLEPFSIDYLRCAACGTLVSQARRIDVERADDSYGRTYWFSHQCERLGLPDIDQRARLDLPERCLHWLRTLLAYKLPPARTLELGCSHGAFVGLLRHAGFDAVGLELNAWVVNHAQRMFRIPILQGPIEQRELPAQSFDAIILNDVLEHLSDPLGTMRHCVSLLKPDGVLLMQTPSYPDPKTCESLEQEGDPFLKMLLPDEHLYLFSERSLRRMFASLDWLLMEFKPALFPYDMYAIVTHGPVPIIPRDTIVTTLSATPHARMVLALLDLDDRHLQQQARLAEQQSTITNITGELETLSADNEARLELVLQHQATVAEQQRVIHDITRTFEDLSADNEARLQLVLQHQATVAEQQRVIHDITRRLEELSADNETRLQVILKQQATIAEQQATIATQQTALSEQRAALAEQRAALGEQQNKIDALERSRVVRLLKYWKLLGP